VILAQKKTVAQEEQLMQNKWLNINRKKLPDILTVTFTRLYVIDILSHIGDKHLVFGDELIHRGDRFLVDLGFDSGNHVSYAVQASTDL